MVSIGLSVQYVIEIFRCNVHNDYKTLPSIAILKELKLKD